MSDYMRASLALLSGRGLGTSVFGSAQFKFAVPSFFYVFLLVASCITARTTPERKIYLDHLMAVRTFHFDRSACGSDLIENPSVAHGAFLHNLHWLCTYGTDSLYILNGCHFSPPSPHKFFWNLYTVHKIDFPL